jgi:hypothetical protein
MIIIDINRFVISSTDRRGSSAKPCDQVFPRSSAYHPEPSGGNKG